MSTVMWLVLERGEQEIPDQPLLCRTRRQAVTFANRIREFEEVGKVVCRPVRVEFADVSLRAPHFDFGKRGAPCSC